MTQSVSDSVVASVRSACIQRPGECSYPACPNRDVCGDAPVVAEAAVGWYEEHRAGVGLVSGMSC